VRLKPKDKDKDKDKDKGHKPEEKDLKRSRVVAERKSSDSSGDDSSDKDSIDKEALAEKRKKKAKLDEIQTKAE